MLNNLGYEFQIPSSNTKFICSDYFEKWLAENEQETAKQHKLASVSA